MSGENAAKPCRRAIGQDRRNARTLSRGAPGLPPARSGKHSRLRRLDSYLVVERRGDAVAVVAAFDMRPFARDVGYEGEPFRWDEAERRHLRARLDALYFHLYGITDEADIRYILSTFPIVERKDRAAFDGVTLTAELIIWYFRALAAGDPTSQAPEAALIRAARRA